MVRERLSGKETIERVPSDVVGLAVVSGRKAFLEGGTANANTLRWGQAWCTQGKAQSHRGRSQDGKGRQVMCGPDAHGRVSVSF